MNCALLTKRTLQRSLTPSRENICVHISGGSFIPCSVPDAIMVSQRVLVLVLSVR